VTDPSHCCAAPHALPYCSALHALQEVKKEIDEAIAAAKAAPTPEMKELWSQIYVGEWRGCLWHTLLGCWGLQAGRQEGGPAGRRTSIMHACWAAQMLCW
jgi:hypothetical protein